MQGSAAICAAKPDISSICRHLTVESERLDSKRKDSTVPQGEKARPRALPEVTNDSKADDFMRHITNIHM
eukprot:768379-Amphidinium_carterae.1